MPLASIPYILVLGFLFGTTLLASRFSVGQYHPANYVALRLALAALAHTAVYLFSTRTWPRDKKVWAHAALLGVVGTAVPMTSIVSSLQYQSSGLTSILLTVGPAITVVLAHFFLPDEKLNRRKVAGVLIALSGAVLLVLLGESGIPDLPASPVGYLLVFAAMVLGSSAAVYIRRFLQGYDSFDLASVRMLFAALALTVFVSLAVGFDLREVTREGYYALGYAAMTGTFFGLIMAIYIAQRFGATASAMTSYVIPVVAAIGGQVLLDEQITPGMLAGMGLIILGITVINRKPRQGNIRPYP